MCTLKNQNLLGNPFMENPRPQTWVDSPRQAEAWQCDHMRGNWAGSALAGQQAEEYLSPRVQVGG